MEDHLQSTQSQPNSVGMNSWDRCIINSFCAASNASDGRTPGSRALS